MVGYWLLKKMKHFWVLTFADFLSCVCIRAKRASTFMACAYMQMNLLRLQELEVFNLLIEGDAQVHTRS